MKNFIFIKKHDDSKLPENIVPELAKMKISIHSEGFPNSGAQFFKGSVRIFIFERKPQQVLIDMLPRLLSEDRISYCLNNEKIIIERLPDGYIDPTRYSYKSSVSDKLANKKSQFE